MWWVQSSPLEDSPTFSFLCSLFKLFLQPFGNTGQTFDTLRAQSTYSSRRLTDQSGGGLAAMALKLLIISASLRFSAVTSCARVRFAAVFARAFPASCH